MRPETANILAFLDEYMAGQREDTAKLIADDFRNRRVERGITREEIAKLSGVALANVARFEQKGLISLSNLVKLANALGYRGELRMIFSQPKFTTMDELLTIRKNKGKKKAYKPKSSSSKQ